MRILFIAHRIPYPPNKGEKIRAFHLIRHLADHHQVHLACLVDEPEDWQHIETLKQHCQTVDAVYRGHIASRAHSLLALISGKSLSVAGFYCARLQRLIDERLNTEKFHLIFVFSCAMAEYTRGQLDVPKVIDFVDVDSEKWRMFAEYHRFPWSWIYRLEANRLADYEGEAAGESECVFVVSKTEAALLEGRVRNCRVDVVSNGVDLHYFQPEANGEPHSPVIVFTGVMDYFPNVDAVTYFCHEIFPLVREVVPESEFLIVGRNPVRTVQELGQQPHVTVTGAIEDVRPYLSRAAVSVAPFRIARGVQNKILEAMAMGVPVVGTPLAFQAMPGNEVDFMRHASTPIQFAEHIVSFLHNAELRRRCSLQARAYVERNFRWEDHTSHLESLLLELLKRVIRCDSEIPKPKTSDSKSMRAK